MPPIEKTIEHAIRESFGCERCGNCCKGGGHAKLTSKDSERLAAWLGMSRASFLGHYAQPQASGEYWLKSQWMVLGPAKMERWCVFLELGGDGLYRCRVNDTKPQQCRDFPARWVNDNTLETCAGMKTLFAKIEKDREEETPREKESEEAA